MTYELLKSIKDTGKLICAKTAIFLIPLTVQLNDEKLVKFYTLNLPRDAISLYRPQQLMKEFGKAENIAVIDLLPYFREWQVRHGKALFLKYDGHWTEDGHEVAASISGFTVEATNA